MTETPIQPETSPLERPPRPIFVKLALLSALAITVLTLGVVGARWFTVRFPDSAMVVMGDPATDGVEIVIRSEADGREVARGKIQKSNDYRFIVLVETGPYVVRARWQDQTVFDGAVYVPRNGVEVRLRLPPGTTAPTATRAAK